MRPEALREAQDWLTRSERDLLAAGQVLVGPPVLADVAVYHTQQAPEKALKAFLAACDVPVPRTHELEQILAQCEAIDPAFRSLLAAAQVLSPYATRFRYPGGLLEPEIDEAREAVELAERVLDFVRQRLSAGGSPAGE